MKRILNSTFSRVGGGKTTGNIQPFAPLDERAALLRRKLLKSPACLAAFDRIVAGIDRERLGVFMAPYRAAADASTAWADRLLDMPYNLLRHLRFVDEIGIDRSRPLRMLDVGSAGGYLALACRDFGHDVLSTDVPEPAVFGALHAFFGLPRLIHTTTADAPWPDTLGGFDLVVARGITFDGRVEPDGTVIWWTLAQWGRFLDRIFDDERLQPRRLILGLNHIRLADGTTVPKTDVIASFVSRGGVSLSTPNLVDFDVARIVGARG